MHKVNGSFRRTYQRWCFKPNFQMRQLKISICDTVIASNSRYKTFIEKGINLKNNCDFNFKKSETKKYILVPFKGILQCRKFPIKSILATD